MAFSQYLVDYNIVSKSEMYDFIYSPDFNSLSIDVSAVDVFKVHVL